MKHKKLLALALAAAISVSALSVTAFAKSTDRINQRTADRFPEGISRNVRWNRPENAESTKTGIEMKTAAPTEEAAAADSTGSAVKGRIRAAGIDDSTASGELSKTADASNAVPTERRQRTDTTSESPATGKTQTGAAVSEEDNADSEVNAQTADGKTITCWVTAYCGCKACSGSYGNMTATGVVAQPNHTIAVDPTVIPYGTQVEINGIIYTAEDCGGAIKGNKIDIYFEEHWQAEQFATGYYTATILT